MITEDRDLSSDDSRKPRPVRIIQVEQASDDVFGTLPTRWAEVQYLYCRSRESRIADTEGQDFLSFVSTDDALCFAVCDGVGQSFFGNWAAKFLGDQLISWLTTGLPGCDQSRRNDELGAFLEELVVTARQEVDALEIPGDLPALLKEALEGLRSYGSETMFAAGRLELGTAGDDPRIDLFWLGDTELRVFDSGGNVVDLGANWTPRERWSSQKGIKGSERVHSWSGTLGAVGRVLAYSDGLSSVSSHLYDLVQQPVQLREAAKEVDASPSSDDLSLIDIRLRDLPCPRLRRIRWPWLGFYKLRWDPVPDAVSYRIEESVGNEAEFRTIATVKEAGYRVRHQPAGIYRYSVRPMFENVQGDTSGSRVVKVVIRVPAWLRMLSRKGRRVGSFGSEVPQRDLGKDNPGKP